MDQQIKDLTDWALASGSLPAGISLDARGTSAPAATLPEDGSTVVRTGANARLFTYLGTLYGAGDGSTTFGLPDSRGRVNVGKGTHTDVDTVGKNDGLAVGSRRVKHKHTHNLTLPDHQHTFPRGNASIGAGDRSQVMMNDVTGAIDLFATNGATSLPAVSGGVGPQTGSEPTDGSAYLVSLKVITL